MPPTERDVWRGPIVLCAFIGVLMCTGCVSDNYHYAVKYRIEYKGRPVDWPIVRDVSISPDGRLFATCTGSYEFKLWDMESGDRIGVFRTEGVLTYYLNFLPGGQMLLVVGAFGKVGLWSIPGGKKLPLDIGKGIWSTIGFSPDGVSVAIGSHAVEAIEIRRGFGPFRRTVLVPLACVNAFSGDGRRIASSNARWLWFWDLRTRKRIAKHTFPYHINAIEFVGGGDRVVIAGGATFREVQSALEVFDLAAGKVVRVLEGHEEPVIRLAVSPDGQYLLSLDDSSIFKVWDTRSWRCTQTMDLGGLGLKLGFAIGPRGQRVVVGGGDGAIVVLERRSGPAPPVPKEQLEEETGGGLYD